MTIFEWIIYLAYLWSLPWVHWVVGFIVCLFVYLPVSSILFAQYAMWARISKMAARIIALFSVLISISCTLLVVIGLDAVYTWYNTPLGPPLESLTILDPGYVKLWMPFILLAAIALPPYFKAHWQNSKAAGIPRGAYHFYDYRVNPISQAEWLLKNCPEPGEHGYALDAEKLKSKLTIKVPARYMDDLGVFCEFIEKETSIQPILYTGFYWWKDNGLEAATWARKYKLWIAGYIWTSPMVPLPWGPDGWTIWQFTNKGKGVNYGIGLESKQVDLDTWRRSSYTN